MANSSSLLMKLISIFFITISIFTPQVLSQSDAECGQDTAGSCIDKAKALPLKIIAIATILITSMIGVCLPLFTRSFPALHPDRNLFIIVKAFAAGIILATGFTHVLPDSFDMLTSSCLKENPWHKFPFTGFVAMLSAIATLMVDSLATSVYSKKCNSNGVINPEAAGERDEDRERGVASFGHAHAHAHAIGLDPKDAGAGQQLMRYRVIAMVSRSYH